MFKRHSLTLLIVLGLLTGCDTQEQIPAQKATAKALPAEPEVQWVDPSKLQPGPIRRESLTPEQMERLKKLQATFAEVDKKPLEKWVENFKRDLNVDNELAIWERMAKAYTAYCSKHELTIGAKTDVYRIVLLRTMASEQDVLERVNLRTLTKDDAVEVMRGF